MATNHTERERIIEQVKRQPSECSCAQCVNMCRRAPCLGTPQDILNLIEAGHVDKLSAGMWAAGIVAGIAPIMMVQLTLTKTGCIMFNAQEGKCTLHDTGLKPLEGILAIHGGDPLASNAHPTVAVAKTWLDDKNFYTVLKIVNAIKAHQDK